MHVTTPSVIDEFPEIESLPKLDDGEIAIDTYHFTLYSGIIMASVCVFA